MFYYGNVLSTGEISELLSSESEAAVWILSRLTTHLVHGHNMRKYGPDPFSHAVEAIRDALAGGEARCPFCDEWAGSVLVFPYEIRSGPFAVVVEEFGANPQKTVHPSFEDAVRDAAERWKRHREETHGDGFSAPMKSTYICGDCYRGFRIRIRPASGRWTEDEWETP